VIFYTFEPTRHLCAGKKVKYFRCARDIVAV